MHERGGVPQLDIYQVLIVYTYCHASHFYPQKMSKRKLQPDASNPNQDYCDFLLGRCLKLRVGSRDLPKYPANARKRDPSGILRGSSSAEHGQPRWDPHSLVPLKYLGPMCASHLEPMHTQGWKSDQFLHFSELESFVL